MKKQLMKKRMRSIMKTTALVFACALILGLSFVVPAHAGLSDKLKDGIDDFAKVARYAALGIGGVVAIYGGIQLGLGFTQDNPDGQSKGIKYIVGGVIILAVGIVLTMFGSDGSGKEITAALTPLTTLM